MSGIIYLTDRSRIVTREECPRKRYLNYDFTIDGEMIGVQRKSASLPLLNGIEIHEAHAKLLAHGAGLPAGKDINTVIAEMRQRYQAQIDERGIFGETDPSQLVNEQMALLEGMLRTFAKLWLPRILEEYDVLTIEKPMDWALAPGLVQKLRFDVVLRRKGDRQLVIMDWKSMAFLSSAWDKKLERSRQTALYIEAAEELFGEPVEMAYLGMVKGTRRKDTAKSSPFFGQYIQASPYLYAYALRGDVGNVYQSEYTAKKGFVKIRTYEEMEMEKWIDHLWHNERNSLNELFVFNPPFAPTKQERRRVRELVVREELKYVEDIRMYETLRKQAELADSDTLRQNAQDFLDFVAAPLREEQCFKYGEEHQCPMYGICFNQGALENPLEDGAYEPRIPHHSTEEEQAA